MADGLRIERPSSAAIRGSGPTTPSSATAAKGDASGSALFASSSGAKRAQVDAALEYALEQAIGERPKRPLALVAEKLRQWDDAINGTWALKRRAEQVFSQATADGSDTLDVAELVAMRQSPEYKEQMLTLIDTEATAESISLNG